MNRLKEMLQNAKSELNLEEKKEEGKKHLQQSKEFIDMNRRKLIIILGVTTVLGAGTSSLTCIFSSKSKSEKEYEKLMEIKNNLKDVKNKENNLTIKSWNSENLENKEKTQKFQESLIKISQIIEIINKWENIFRKKEKIEFLSRKDQEEITALFEDITNSCFEIESKLSLYYQKSYEPDNIHIDISRVVHILGEIKNSFENNNDFGTLNLKEKLLRQHKKLTKLSAYLQTKHKQL